ncbi:MAG: hypothetical protein RSD96_01385 [Bacilli bacterium]
MYNNNLDNRFIAFPFLLGALTGGAAVAIFNPYRPRPVYPVYQVPPVNNGYYYGYNNYY